MIQTRRALLRKTAAGVLGMYAGGTVRHAGAQSTPAPSPVASPVAGGPPLLVSASEALSGGAARVWLAVMGPDVFGEGFIEGASRVNWDELGLAESSEEAIAAWEDKTRALLSARGVPFDSPVTTYDEGTLFAAKGWWQLAYLGHPDVTVLDGGLAAWTEAGGDIETAQGTGPLETPISDPGAIRREMLATKDQVLASLGDDNVFMLDARSSDEYAGGHIPGAVNVPYTDNAIMKDANVYLPPDVLRQLYADLGMAEGKRAIAYCSTGTRGAVGAFALRLAGFTDVALYVPSWGEWSADPDAPVE
jgi:thiosulfate/3-mercaptopyruvate sulfurtransferase